MRRLVEAINDRFDVDGSELQPFLGTNSERVELSAERPTFRTWSDRTRRIAQACHYLFNVFSPCPDLNARRVSDLLLGEPARASLAWNDFEHLADLRDLAARIVAAAGGLRGAARRGANLLFYGPPGTGKSEFAKTLGAHLGFSVQFCGETGEENVEPNRRERIAALLIANAVGAVARRTIVVVDEADDLLAGLVEDDAFNRRGSKVFMNRLVERAAAPTIWITNDVDRLGPAIIRRMSLALRFPKPTLSVRKTMVARDRKESGLSADRNRPLGTRTNTRPARAHRECNLLRRPYRRFCQRRARDSWQQSASLGSTRSADRVSVNSL